MTSLHLSDLGKPRRFHMHWPHIDTTGWPGRELFWLYTHPTLGALWLITSVFVLGGSVHDWLGY